MELIESILKWYAIICIFCTPFSVIVMLYMIKKQPKTVKRINDAIDRILDGKPKNEEKSEGKSHASQTTPETQEKAPVKSEEEQNEDIGIANLNMLLEDSYRCYLTPENIQNIGLSNLNDWKSSNRFVADFTDPNNDSVIHALKAGKAIIYSGNVQIYHLTVRPRVNGFIQKFMYCVLEKKHYSNIKMFNKNRKILKESQTKRMLTFDKNWDCPKMTYGWTAKGIVNRLLIEIDEKDKTLINDIIKTFEDHFLKLNLNNNFTGVTYWLHGAPTDMEYEQAYIDAKIQTVDYAAMIKYDGKSICYVGITSIWRQGADINEVYNNPQMIDRCFEEMLPEDLMQKMQNMEPVINHTLKVQETVPEEKSDKKDDNTQSENTADSPQGADEFKDDDTGDASDDNDDDIDTNTEDYSYNDGIDPNYDDGDEDEPNENMVDDIDSEPF